MLSSVCLKSSIKHLLFFVKCFKILPKDRCVMIFKQYYNHNAEKIKDYSEKFGLSQRTMSLLLNRGLDNEIEIDEFLHPDTLLNPFDLLNMRELIERIKFAKLMGDKVLIFGDYDVDGVSATAIMLKALKKYGIEADFFLPNRYVDGYGLSRECIDRIAQEYMPNLIITVDCGISCYEEVEYAKEKGIEIIITDHHEIPDILPDTIVLNAKIKGQAFGFTELCGTGLAYKIAEALLGEKVAEEFLPIAAIATIADIVPLIGENRAIVKKGLALFEKYLPIGIKMLLKENNLHLTKVTSTDISFKISPKLNASGRMGDASDSLMLYMLDDPVKLKYYISKINEHNEKRQKLCTKVTEDAIKALERQDMKNTRVICLASKTWDQGILGIACSRLVEKYKRPVFLFAYDGEMLTGSGRSIDDINIHQLIVSCKDILSTYGGHTMAVGLTLKRANYEEFNRRVNAFVYKEYSDKAFMPIKYYDQEITTEEITPLFLKELELLEPVGCGNPRPRFKITTENAEIQPMKYNILHAQIKINDLELLFFNYSSYASMLELSRQKSFIFELTGECKKKGIVTDFDGGKLITSNANFLTKPFELQQLLYEKDKDIKFNYYTKNDLIKFVSNLNTTVFGTAFVTFSGYDFVEFSRIYEQKNIYEVLACSECATGYNSILLSPQKVDWAKNFSKIIFLSPVLSWGYISEIQKVSNAEIFLPIDKQIDKRNYQGIDLSRETFGKIYKILTTKSDRMYINLFDFYHKQIENKNIRFNTFYSAILVFEELNILKVEYKQIMMIKVINTKKHDLNSSKIYRKLLSLKEMR